MTDQAPIERAVEAIERATGTAFAAAREAPTERDLAVAVHEAVDTDELAKVVRRHRRNRAVNFGRDYACLCGEVLRSNSHHVQSDHIAQAVKNWLTGKDQQ